MVSDFNRDISNYNLFLNICDLSNLFSSCFKNRVNLRTGGTFANSWFKWSYALHLCSLYQLLSGFILIFPSRKFFEVVAPSAIVLPILAIITPVNGYLSLDNFFYYDYFILHTLIIFAYLYVYKYGLVEKPYSGLLFKWQLLWLTLFSIIAVIWDWIFKTNQLFVGPSSGETWNNGCFNVGGWNTNFIGAKYMWPFALLPMFFLGIVIVSLTHILLFYLPQSFLYDKKTKK